jgi:serine/threonine-protein kinase
MDAVAQLNSALTGRYEVEREIGAGGMATVYLARDLRHDRRVALKVLKPELGAVLGVERFLAEIKVTANLQHPNLLPLFDSGEAEGLLFYVMPFVEGETLRARLAREKQLPVDEAVRIAVAIASALDYAHSQGVIHRDLKPENILIQAGQPVIADFGIALAVSKAGGARITQTGLSLGTPQYMSPEQATGDRTIDGRTDIYSLGAILYEMLSGEPPHAGPTSQAIIAKLMTEEVRPVSGLRRSVPPYVDAAVKKALEKLPADRFTHAREFGEALSASHAVSAVTSGASARGRAGDFSIAFSIPKEKIRVAARWAAIAAVLVVGAWGWLRPSGSTTPRRVRFQLVVSDSFRIRPEQSGQNFAISPDGSQIVFLGGSATDQLYVRGLNDLEARPIRGTEQARQTKFSPDGKWLAFLQAGRLKKIPMSGGPAVTIADSSNEFSWGDGDVVVFKRGRGLWRVSAAGGVPTLIAMSDTAKGETSLSWPFVLPGGKAALFDVVTQNDNASAQLAAVRFDDREVIPLGVTGRNARYVASGHIVFGRLDGTIVAAPFDAARLRVTGPAVTVVEGVFVKGGGASEFGVALDGTLFFVEGQSEGELDLVDRMGAARPLLPGAHAYANPRSSPTSGRVVFQMAERATFAKTDIWVYNDLTKTVSRLTNDGKSTRPEWMADGQRVVWMNTDTAGLQVRRQLWDGTGKPETLFGGLRGILSVTPSPSGKLFALVTLGKATDIYVAEGDPPTQPRPLVATPAIEAGPRFSPDGRWVAYHGDESGQREVYVIATSGDGGRHQISTAGGAEPVWAPDGKTLYYRAGGRMMAAGIATSSAFVVTSRQPLFTDLFRSTNQTTTAYDVSRDGKSFLMLGRGDEKERVIVVTGWLDELKERMALATKK